MKKDMLLLLATLLIISCNSGETKDNSQPVTVESLDWLIGNWIRTNEEPGLETSENWQKVNDSTYTAHSYTMKGSDTTWQEHTTLSPREGVWVFRVQPGDGSGTTDFRLIAAGKETFSCENKRNDFPKLIKYRRNGDELLADISGGRNKVEFIFRKQE